MCTAQQGYRICMDRDDVDLVPRPDQNGRATSWHVRGDPRRTVRSGGARCGRFWQRGCLAIRLCPRGGRPSARVALRARQAIGGLLPLGAGRLPVVEPLGEVGGWYVGELGQLVDLNDVIGL